MSEEGLTEIVCVIDKSGSMSSTADDAIGGFNEFLARHRELGNNSRLTLTLFDTNYDIVHKSILLEDVVELSCRNYAPGGMTALFDAVGRTIDEVAKAHEELDESERPDKVLMVILTDGQENSSKEYAKDLVLSKISEYREKNWEFVFLGADESAFEESRSLGFDANMTRGFEASSGVGIRNMFDCMDSAYTSYRSGKKIDLGEDKEKSDE